MTPEKVKARLREQGKPISQWAKEHGFPARAVYRVLEGIDKGHYGQAHEIAVALGLKPQTRLETAAA